MGGSKLSYSSDSLLSQDTEHRRRALELDSFIVEAPAGAGKTELLTQRYLRLLATVDEPEEIIAITFTNKAAGEMRERIADSLDMVLHGQMPELDHKRITFDLATAALARSAARGWGLDTQRGRLRLTTIDALCASLARQMPYLSRFGAQPAVAEDARRYYEEASRRALDHLGDDDEEGEAIAVALIHLDNDTDRLIALLSDMLARREQWRTLWQVNGNLDHPESVIGKALSCLVGEELERSTERLGTDLQRQLMPLARYAAANLAGGPLSDWTEPLDSATQHLNRWRALADLILTKEGERRKTVTVKNGFPAEGKATNSPKAAMLELLAHLEDDVVMALRRVRELPNASLFDAYDEKVVRALVRLLKLAAAELWLVFSERGEVDFGELATRAISALGAESAPTELALRLDYRIRHLLVDEFQDTSPMQIDLLSRLTAGWQAGDGRTLFAVGDPMQSIYRFRKADVGLFLRVAELGIGFLKLTPLRLSRNNRSHPEVVNWINAHFPQVFPTSDDPLHGEIRYRPFVATRPELSHAGVFVHPVLAYRDEDKEQVAHREARALIGIITEEWNIDPQRKVAILVRARHHLSALVAAMRRSQSGWHFTALEIEPLVGRQVVQDLLSLTRALHHRADRLHWLAVLRAPWCGLTLTDLHVLAGDDHVATLWSLMNDQIRVGRLSPNGQIRLSHFRNIFGEALAGQGRQGRRRWVEDVWKKLGGPLCVGSSDLADAEAFFRRLDALDSTGRFALDTLEDDMNKLYAAIDAQSDGRLQFMTIHKSKGLEFDTVILPGLHREPLGRDTPLLSWDSFLLEEGERLVAAPVNRRRGKSNVPTAYDFLQRMERERSRNEEARVLYVAATRAISRLHLVGVVGRRSDGGLSAPRAAAPLGRLWPVVEADYLRAAAPIKCSMERDGSLSDFVPQLLRLKAPAELVAWQAPLDIAPTLLPRAQPVDALGAAIGTLGHACLEQMAGRLGDWSVARVSSLQIHYGLWLASRGWNDTEAADGAKRVVAMLCKTLESESGRWLLQQRDDSHAELALASVGAGGTTETRVVDRCFVDNDVRWIIDYKTAWLGDNATESLLYAHAQNYLTQLAAYAVLFSHENRAVRIGVFYVAHGSLITLDYN